MAYGYEGDATADSASLAGIGDDNNQLYSTPDHQSVAITRESRAARFGLTPEQALKHTGLSFTEGGKTYYDDDTAPTDFTYNGQARHNSTDLIDVFDPSHAPDNVTGARVGIGGHEYTVSGSKVSLRSGYDDTTPSDIPSSIPIGDAPIEDEPPVREEPKRSPLEEFRYKLPQFNNKPDAEVLADMHARLAPSMPMAQFADLAKLPDGRKAIATELAKGKTGLQRLKEMVPEAAANGISDDQLQEDMYNRLSRTGKINANVVSLNDFKDQMSPQSGPVNAAYQFWKGASRGASEEGHALSGQAYGQAQNARDFSDQIYNLMDQAFISSGVQPGKTVRSWAKAADDWMAKNTPVEDYWRKFVGWMNQQSGLQNQAVAKDAQRAKLATGGAGTFGRVGGGAAVGLPAGMLMMIPGAPVKSAVMLAGAYEGLSRVGAAVQAGHDDALIEGIQGFGMGAIGRYMMNSPNGRAMAGFNMWLANTGEDTVQKWLKGEKVDWTEQAMRSSVDILTGVLMGKGKEPERVFPSQEALKHEYSYAGAEDTGAAVHEEVSKAEIAQKNNATDQASKNLDAALSIMTPKGREEVAQKVISVARDATNNKKEPVETKKTPLEPKADEATKIIHQHFYGLSAKRPSEAGYTLDWAGEIHDWFQDHWPEIKKKLGGPARYVASVMENWNRDFQPQKLGPEAEQMWAISKGRTSEAKRAERAVPTEIARSMEINKVMKGGEKAGRRETVFNHFSDAQLKQQLIDRDTPEGRAKGTGNKAADFIYKFHDVGYAAMNQIEKAAGIEYDAREYYQFHALKDRNRRQAYETWFKNRVNSGDPRFAKERSYPTWKEAMEAGFEPASLNPERLFQMRMFQHAQAIRKIMTLRDAETAGIAFRSNDPDISKDLKVQWPQVTSPAGETYYVEPRAAAVIKNGWEPTSLYTNYWHSPFWKALSLGKGISASIELGWSIVHPRHIINMGMAHTLTQMQRAGLSGPDRAAAWRKQLSSAFKLGITNSREIQAWRGQEIKGGPLTDAEKRNIQHAQDMGLDFSISEERAMQFGNQLRKWFGDWTIKANKYTGHVFEVGYKVLSSEPAQHFLFDTIIPRQKFNAAMSLRDSLLRAHPELESPGHEMELKLAFAKAGENIEARFGEMFMDNLYWKKINKDIGQSTLLSLGWQLSLLRIYGGAVHDMGSNVAHLGEVVKKLRGEASDHTFLTDRLLFAVNYTALSLLQSGIVTYLATRKQPEGMDYFFPRVGTNPNGTAKRVTPIEFPREFASLWRHMEEEGVGQGIATFTSNKFQPFLQTLIQEWQNKNFYGQMIANPLDSDYQQWMDRIAFGLSNTGIPIPFRGLAQSTGQPWEPKDTILSVLGYPVAPSWPNKSGTERLIGDTYNREFGGGSKTKEDVDKQNMDRTLRAAVVSGDMASRKEAVHQLRKMGTTDKAINEVIKSAHIAPEEYMFQRLSHTNDKGAPRTSTQAKILSRMAPEERKKYLKHANKAVQAEFRNESVFK
jgi:hypothetical protein